MDGWVSIGTKLDTKEFDAQIEQVQKKLDDIESTLEIGQSGTFKLTESEMVDLSAEAEKLRNRLKGLKEQQDKLGKSNLVSVKKIMEDIGNSTGKVIKQIGRWTLAIFGVRAVYSFVRNSINTIANDNEQLKTDIDYMRDALAYSIEPIITKIVDLAKQLMFYGAYLIQAWTGKNIFENANKSLKGANKQAKDLKKTMAGFDEMNVLNSGSSTGGGTTSPSFDLSSIENMKEPKWLIMVKDIGQWIIDNWEQVVFGLLLTKLFIDLLTGNWIGVVISFIGLLISAFFQIKDAIIVIWEDGRIVLGMFIDWIYDKFIKPLGDFFGALWNGLVIGFERAINGIKNTFNSVVNFFKNIINTIVGLFKTIGTKVGDAIGGAFKTVINGVLKAIETILNKPINAINNLLDVINAVPGIDLGRLPTFKLPRLAVGGIVNMPSRGVPIGGAIAGEAGAEGVIPLTDSQAMETLGQAIGKYINVNLTNITKLNNRQIAREQKKINAQSDFAFNR